MTAGNLNTLIRLSGITEQTSYQTHDISVPMYRDHRYGQYPHNGNAIAVYWRESLFPQIISYRELAQMAFDRPIYLQRWEREYLREVVSNTEEVDV